MLYYVKENDALLYCYASFCFTITLILCLNAVYYVKENDALLYCYASFSFTITL